MYPVQVNSANTVSTAARGPVVTKAKDGSLIEEKEHPSRLTCDVEVTVRTYLSAGHEQASNLQFWIQSGALVKDTRVN